MIVEGTSRLWPVLILLVLLPALGLGLEQVAMRRGTAERVIHVEAAHVEADDVNVATTLPVSPEHEAARALLKRGDLDGGLALFGSLAVANAASAAIAFEYGAALLDRRNTAAAIVQLQRARALAPDDPRVAVVLAKALVKKKETAAAEAELRRALVVRPGYGPALRALGRLYSASDRAPEAIAQFTEASRFGSNEERASALVALGAELLGAGRGNDAQAAFNQAIERAPAQVEVRLGVARAWLSTGKKDDVSRASGVLAVAADLAPDLPEVQTALGQQREASGDLDGAEDAYWQAIRLAPQSPPPRRRLLRLALDRQRLAKARQQADDLLGIDPEDPEHHFLAGLVASRQDDNAAARAHYLVAIDKSGGDYPEAYFNLGLIEKDDKNLDAAIAAYQQAIRQRPGYHAAENNLGLTLIAANRADEAEKLYRDVLARSPSYAPAWVNLGKLYSQQKKYAEAIDAYQKALEARPDYARALLDLGVAYARSGRVDDAVATYQRAIILNPRSVSAVYNLGLVQAQQGKQSAAEETWTRALAIDANHVPSQRKLAASLAARGNDVEARARFEDLLDAEPRDVEARLGLATLLKKAGDKTACMREASLALSHLPPGAADQRASAAALLQSCQP